MRAPSTLDIFTSGSCRRETSRAPVPKCRLTVGLPRLEIHEGDLGSLKREAKLPRTYHSRAIELFPMQHSTTDRPRRAHIRITLLHGKIDNYTRQLFAVGRLYTVREDKLLPIKSFDRLPADLFETLLLVTNSLVGHA